MSICPGGGIGRHKGLKIPRQQWRAGSSPAPGTIIFLYLIKHIHLSDYVYCYNCSGN